VLTSFRVAIVYMMGMAILLAGCSGVEPVQLTPTPAPPTSVPTRTLAVSRTPTAEFTHTPAPTVTITPTPQPTSEMETARLVGTGSRPNWQYFFTVEAEEALQGRYYGVVAGNKQYACEIIPQNPNRIYCHGPLAGLDRWVDYVIYEQATEQRVHEGQFFIPLNLLP
jgi:hypothetical protein